MLSDSFCLVFLQVHKDVNERRCGPRRKNVVQEYKSHYQAKPMTVFPRIAKLDEHRNELQLATAEKMKELGYVYVANTAEELKALLVDPRLSFSVKYCGSLIRGLSRKWSAIIVYALVDGFMAFY